MTTRRDIEGTLARWFALDADSRIGVFTGPYAAWPATVFDDYATVEKACEFLRSAPVSTEAILSAAWLASGADPTYPVLEASRGLYSFDADPGHGGATLYSLDALPAHPLLEQQAAPVLRRAARLVCFPQIRFAEVEHLDLRELVPFVVGDG